MSHCGNAQKTGFSEVSFQQGFWPPPSGGPLRSRLHARSTDASLADPRHARIRSQAQLDHRRADQRGRLRRGATGTTRNSDRCRTTARNRCRAGVATGSLGPVRRGSGFDATRTSASRCGLRVADRSTRSDHARRPRHGRTALRVRRVRTRDPSRACPCRFSSCTAATANASAARPRWFTKPSKPGKLYRQGISKSEIARTLNIGRTSVRRLLAEKKS